MSYHFDRFPDQDHLRHYAYVTSLTLPVLYVIWYLYKGRGTFNRFPQFKGPPGLPLLGNIHQLGEMQWLKYTEWHAKYGPIYRLNFAGQSVLVVGSAKIAADLMERRSAIYSDRPNFIMASDILMGGLNLAFARYGDRWKKMRRAATSCLSAKVAQEYTTLQEMESVNLLQNLLHEKGNIDPLLRRTAASSVLKTVYAYPNMTKEDQIVHRVENYVDRMLKAALPGNYLVDIFPIMTHIPAWLAKWKREGLAWFKSDSQLFLGLVEDVKTGLSDGTRSVCLVSKLLEQNPVHKLEPIENAWLAGMMFGAGAEAMAATLSVFVMAMVLYPRVQSKLRAEVESVVDKDSLPTYVDVKNLPYLNAVIKETLRWRPMGPLAVPHRSSEDDVYDGHFIPAGTLIIPNVWAMHHDEAVYPQPEEFRPERYLENDGITPLQISDTRDLGHHAFGFGRRSCIGYSVANNALAINAANIVYCFQINKAKDAFGHDITPNPDAMLDEGLAVRPEPYECQLVPRSDAIVNLIRRAVADKF